MSPFRSYGRRTALALMIALAATAPTMAQDTPAETGEANAAPSLTIELNRAVPTDNG